MMICAHFLRVKQFIVKMNVFTLMKIQVLNLKFQKQNNFKVMYFFHKDCVKIVVPIIQNFYKTHY